MTDEIPLHIQRAVAAIARTDAIMAQPRPECDPWLPPMEPTPAPFRKAAPARRQPDERPEPAVDFDALRSLARSVGKIMRDELDKRVRQEALLEFRIAKLEARLAAYEEQEP